MEMKIGQRNNHMLAFLIMFFDFLELKDKMANQNFNFWPILVDVATANDAFKICVIHPDVAESQWTCGKKSWHLFRMTLSDMLETQQQDITPPNIEKILNLVVVFQIFVSPEICHK